MLIFDYVFSIYLSYFVRFLTIFSEFLHILGLKLGLQDSESFFILFYNIYYLIL
jgi:hypothetical protein